MNSDNIPISPQEAQLLNTLNKNYENMCEVEKNLIDTLKSTIDSSSSEYIIIMDRITKYRESIQELSKTINALIKDLNNKII